jgi:hypothetical protein
MQKSCRPERYLSIGRENHPPPTYGLVVDTVPDKNPPGWLAESLERSEAQIAAGQTVPIEPVLDRLRASIARMKAGTSEAEQKIVRKA